MNAGMTDTSSIAPCAGRGVFASKRAQLPGLNMAARLPTSGKCGIMIVSSDENRRRAASGGGLTMKTGEIHIRDPFVLVHGGKYYLYGTRGATCWGMA